MSDETPVQTKPASRPMPWRWMIFGVSLVAIVVLLTMFAMDRVNVVWEAGVPHCPHCRTQVQAYATVCGTCRQGYDWVAEDTLCKLCLTEHDVVRVRMVAEERRREMFTGALGSDPERVDALLEWTREIEAGECTYCGGTGEDLFAAAMGGTNGNGKRTPCPICDGDGDCVLCDGDEMVRRGEVGAHADLLKHRDRIVNLRGRLESPDPAKFRNAVRDTLRALRGRAEAAQVLDAAGWPVVDRATAIREEALGLLSLKPSAER